VIRVHRAPSSSKPRGLPIARTYLRAILATGLPSASRADRRRGRGRPHRTRAADDRELFLYDLGVRRLAPPRRGRALVDALRAHGARAGIHVVFVPADVATSTRSTSTARSRSRAKVGGPPHTCGPHTHLSMGRTRRVAWSRTARKPRTPTNHPPYTSPAHDGPLRRRSPSRRSRLLVEHGGGWGAAPARGAGRRLRRMARLASGLRTGLAMGAPPGPDSLPGRHPEPFPGHQRLRLQPAILARPIRAQALRRCAVAADRPLSVTGCWR